LPVEPRQFIDVDKKIVDAVAQLMSYRREAPVANFAVIKA
jgi:hypothetical protein